MTSSTRDSVTSRRRDRAPAADAEAGSAVYRTRHHQTSEPVVEYAYGRGTAIGHGGDGGDARGTVVAATGSSGGGVEPSRKSTREMRPLEQHASLASGVDERETDVTATSSVRRHTTGQVHDHRYQDTSTGDVRAAKNSAVELRRYSRSPADGAYSTERGRGLAATDADMKTADVVVEGHRKTSPRRVTVDAGKETERTRPAVVQSGGHAAYYSRRTSDLHDRDRCK